ncbi:MAG: peptidoglycan-associated lipoprotein [Nitrospiraceae bacterium]|nr:MAG: peptidoglycan-associated lipoprotein [Nitrospiraceae bacterium]
MNRLSIALGRGLLVLGMVLPLAACSMKGTSGTTTGQEKIVKPEPVQPAPLRGFTRAPVEEVVKAPAPAPPLVAKADPSEFEARRMREMAQRALGDVYFEFDRWGLSPEGKKNLDQNAEILKQNPRARILIEGHCDERGSIEYNLVLGEKRAQETRRHLLTLGITNPVGVTSYGKERPVCIDPDESCYWKNRRAHLVLEDGR